MEKGKTEKIEKTLPSILGDYAQSGSARFHMPGHKIAGIGGFFREELAKWDLTFPTDEMLRDAVSKTEEKYSRIYGAKNAFLLTEGVDMGIRTMFLALNRRERVLFCRNASKALVSGLVLSGLESFSFMPDMDETNELVKPPSKEDVERELIRTGASVFYIKSPDNYGFCADLRGIAEVCHKHGALLLADASYGAHFPFSPLFPESPSVYADLCCCNISATMNALNPSAVLFLGNCRVKREDVEKALELVKTGEPSTLLLSSLDWALYTAGRQDWSAYFKHCELVKESINAMQGLSVLSQKDLPKAAARDVSKTVVDVSKRNITGTEAMAFFNLCGIYPQTADRKHIVLSTGPEDASNWYYRLYKALEQIPKYRNTSAVRIALPRPGEKALTVREAFMTARHYVPVSEAAGRICAETVEILPYGILCVLPGEVLTAEIIENMENLRSCGISVAGITEGKIGVI